MRQELVSGVIALPDSVGERSVGVGPGSPHVLVCGGFESIHLLTQPLGTVPLALTLLNVSVAMLCPGVRHTYTVTKEEV